MVYSFFNIPEIVFLLCCWFILLFRRFLCDIVSLVYFLFCCLFFKRYVQKILTKTHFKELYFYFFF